MRIGFVVNDILTEQDIYTTTRLALAAVNRGHESWLIGTADLALDPDDVVRAHARAAPRDQYKSTKAYLSELQGPKGVSERISVDDLDVLMLRNDPAEDQDRRSWAQSAGIMFGHAAIRRGVIVLNDPNALAKAMNKMYFQLYPEEIRPKTLISRNREEIRKFAKNHNDDIIIKPLQGSGGQGVFHVRRDDMANINQIIESVSRDGYVVAQEYLKEAEAGDTRLFMMNGMPLRYKGKYAAFRRLRPGEGARGSIHAAASKAPAAIDDNALRIAELVRPKLVEDGMFLVGLDIVGDKLMEINVFTPGGLGSARQFEGVNFAHAVVEALERKVNYVNYYQSSFNNVALATL
jgi:glutathione synthase